MSGNIIGSSISPGNIMRSGKGKSGAVPSERRKPAEPVKAGAGRVMKGAESQEDNMASMWNSYACGTTRKVSHMRNEEPEGLNPGACANIVTCQAEIALKLMGIF